LTATQNQTSSSIAPHVGVWRDRSTARATIASPSFSTKSGNELLLAFRCYERCLRTQHHSPDLRTRIDVGSCSRDESPKWHGGDMEGICQRFSKQSVRDGTSVSESSRRHDRHELYWSRHNRYQRFMSHWCNRQHQRLLGRPHCKADYKPQQLLGVWSVGNDYDNTISRTPGAGQTLIHHTWPLWEIAYWSKVKY
jgi:hypothetical protein